jgi:hypothetical protein
VKPATDGRFRKTVTAVIGANGIQLAGKERSRRKEKKKSKYDVAMDKDGDKATEDLISALGDVHNMLQEKRVSELSEM